MAGETPANPATSALVVREIAPNPSISDRSGPAHNPPPHQGGAPESDEPQLAEFPGGRGGGRHRRGRPGQGSQGRQPRAGLDRRRARAAGPRHRARRDREASRARAGRHPPPDLPARAAGLLRTLRLSAPGHGRVPALLQANDPAYQSRHAFSRDADPRDAAGGGMTAPNAASIAAANARPPSLMTVSIKITRYPSPSMSEDSPASLLSITKALATPVYIRATATGDASNPMARSISAVGPFSAEPPTIGAIATVLSRGRSAPPTLRIGAIEMSGFDGPMTTMSASASASRTSGVGRAESIPSNSTSRSAGASRSRDRYSWNEYTPLSVTKRVRTRSSLIGSTRASMPHRRHSSTDVSVGRLDRQSISERTRWVARSLSPIRNH